MLKIIMISVAILTLLASHALAFDLRLTGERIDLRAVDEPLQNILRGMAQQGVRVRVDPQVNPRVSAAYENRDLRETMAILLKSYDHVLVWEKMPQTPASFRLAEIQIFRPGQKELIQELNPRVFLLAKDPQDGTLFVRDELLLQVKSGADLGGFLKTSGGRVIDKNETLGIYKIRLPPDADIPAIISRLKTLPGIVQAEPDFAYPSFSPYRADLSRPTGEIAKVFRKEGNVPVAVLDTGLQEGIGPDGFVIASFDAVIPAWPLSDHLGHGTQMALIASGLVKPIGAQAEGGGQIPVVAIRAMDDNGFTTDFTILKGIDFAIGNGARVMSLSWGSEKRSDFLEKILNYAAAKGMIIVASAGNEPTGQPVYPAAYPSVLGVGAVYPNGKTWEKSNYGSFVSLYAPGFAELPVGYKGDPGIYGGTSISAAFAANRIADYLSKFPESGIQQIKAAVQDSKLRIN
ncbi:MAG: S8 family peptidase [Syntrophales bacterium]